MLRVVFYVKSIPTNQKLYRLAYAHIETQLATHYFL